MNCSPSFSSIASNFNYVAEHIFEIKYQIDDLKKTTLYRELVSLFSAIEKTANVALLFFKTLAKEIPGLMASIAEAIEKGLKSIKWISGTIKKTLLVYTIASLYEKCVNTAAAWKEIFQLPDDDPTKERKIIDTSLKTVGIISKILSIPEQITSFLGIFDSTISKSFESTATTLGVVTLALSTHKMISSARLLYSATDLLEDLKYQRHMVYMDVIKKKYSETFNSIPTRDSWNDYSAMELKRIVRIAKKCVKASETSQMTKSNKLKIILEMPIENYFDEVYEKFKEGCRNFKKLFANPRNKLADKSNETYQEMKDRGNQAFIKKLQERLQANPTLIKKGFGTVIKKQKDSKVKLSKNRKKTAKKNDFDRLSRKHIQKDSIYLAGAVRLIKFRLWERQMAECLSLGIEGTNLTGGILATSAALGATNPFLAPVATTLFGISSIYTLVKAFSQEKQEKEFKKRLKALVQKP